MSLLFDGWITFFDLFIRLVWVVSCREEGEEEEKESILLSYFPSRTLLCDSGYFSCWIL